MIDHIVTENVFYCPGDEVAFTSIHEAKDCSVCGRPLEACGWFESDGGDKAEK